MSAFFPWNVTPPTTEHHTQPTAALFLVYRFGILPGEHGTLSTMPGRNHGSTMSGTSYVRTCCRTRGHTSPDNGKRHTLHRGHHDGSTWHATIRQRFTPTTATTAAALIADHTAQKKPPRGRFRWGCFLLRVLFHNQVRVSRRFYYQAIGRLIRGREEACISAYYAVGVLECFADRTEDAIFRADFCRGCRLVILFYAAAGCACVGRKKTLALLGGCFYSFHFFICFGLRCKGTAKFRSTQTFPNFSCIFTQIFHRKHTFCKLRLCK